MSFIHSLFAAAATCVMLALPAHAQRVGQVEVNLVAERAHLQSGVANTVGLQITPDPGWHVYWRNPGDSGLPTTLNWKLPKGVTADPLQWPYPHAQRVDATLTNYGYEGEVLHPVTLKVAAPLSGQTVTLTANASWLVCKDVCIPGKATLTLTQPVRAGVAAPNGRLVDAFARARAQLPMPFVGGGRFQVDAKQLNLALTGDVFTPGQRVAFFPYLNSLVEHAAPQAVKVEAGKFSLSQARSPYFDAMPEAVEGVLVLGEGSSARALEIRAMPGEAAGLPLPVMADAVASTEANAGQVAADKVDAARSLAASASPPDGSMYSWPMMLLFAFLGGLILNLMPCVFPVLSIKALALAESGGESRAAQRGHALAYTAGVLVSFLAAAGLLLALRAGGASLGWGFQLQSPVFVAVLAYVLFALGLSMSGLVEFGGRLMGAGQSLAAKPGHAGAFFTGVLAVLVASPCTAPFMGAALGFALTQSAFVSLSVFAALGLGLAAPFLAIGFVPALARKLPRPGAWMVTFRQAMAFPLYLTVVWLLWVLARQTGADAIGLVLAGMTVLAFGLWLRSRAIKFAPLVVVAALALLAHPMLRAPASGATATSTEASDWQPYSASQVQALAGGGQTVFVNFTADWCLTCKVNERTTLASDRIQRAFAERNIALVKGDWTRYDPTITAALAEHGRSGVPLYLVVRPGGKTEVLPQILTPGGVMEALK